MPPNIQPALVQAVGTLLGGLIALGTAVLVTIFTNRRLKIKRYAERRKELIREIYEDEMQSLHLIESHIYKIKALTNSMSNPFVNPKTLVQEMLRDLWQLGAESARARFEAETSESIVLMECLSELDKLFQDAWKQVTSGQDQGERFKELDDQVSVIMHRAGLEINRLRRRARKNIAKDLLQIK